MIGKKIIARTSYALMLLCSAYAQPARAQSGSVTPYPAEEEVTAKLFNVEEQTINYHFTVEMPGANFLVVEWDKLSVWHDKGDLDKMIATAKKYYGQVQDSFKGSLSAKRLDIHLPISNEPVTVKITEHEVKSNVLLLKGSLQTPLKVNTDTIRMVKTITEVVKGKKKRLVQMQYTFLLKDLNEISNLANRQLVENVENTFDSIVTKYRHKWKNQDRWAHNLNVKYFPLNNDPKKRLTIEMMDIEENKGRFYETIEVSSSLGITLFRNLLCPSSDVGLAYKWPTRGNEYAFVRASLSSFAEFEKLGSTKYQVYNVSFVNAEFGIIKNKGTTLVPAHQVSIGVGYKVNLDKAMYRDPSLPNDMYRVFANYRVSKIFTICPEVYFTGDRSGGIYGISGVFRIF
jgi:hypothetical protein